VQLAGGEAVLTFCFLSGHDVFSWLIE